MELKDLLAFSIREEIGPEHVGLASNVPALVALVADGIKYRSDLIDDLCHVGAIPSHLAPDAREAFIRMPGEHLAAMLLAFEENQ
jgi:hypothetical protein